MLNSHSSTEAEYCPLTISHISPERKRCPSTKAFIEEFNLLGRRMACTFNALCHIKEKQDQKLLIFKERRKVWNVAYYVVATAISLYLCVHVSSRTFGVTAVVMKPLKMVVDWIWDKFQSKLEKEKEGIVFLEQETREAIPEFNRLFDRLKEDVEEENSEDLEIAIQRATNLNKAFSKVERLTEDVIRYFGQIELQARMCY